MYVKSILFLPIFKSQAVILPSYVSPKLFLNFIVIIENSNASTNFLLIASYQQPGRGTELKEKKD
jgi:hypothetical protein